MRNEPVKEQQKKYSCQKSHHRRDKGQLSHMLRLLYCGDKQAPHRSRCHYTCGKACKYALNCAVQTVFHKKHAERTKRSSEKGYKKSLNDFCIYHKVSPLYKISYHLLTAFIIS